MKITYIVFATAATAIPACHAFTLNGKFVPTASRRKLLDVIDTTPVAGVESLEKVMQLAIEDEESPWADAFKLEPANWSEQGKNVRREVRTDDTLLNAVAAVASFERQRRRLEQVTQAGVADRRRLDSILAPLLGGNTGGTNNNGLFSSLLPSTRNQSPGGILNNLFGGGTTQHSTLLNTNNRVAAASNTPRGLVTNVLSSFTGDRGPIEAGAGIAVGTINTGVNMAASLIGGAIGTASNVAASFI